MCILITAPILVKPLLIEEQEALHRHGCIVEPYPQIAIVRPDRLKGHRITFPVGTEMAKADRCHTQYSMHFPDNYQPTLIWQQEFYYFYPERDGSGHLV